MSKEMTYFKTNILSPLYASVTALWSGLSYRLTNCKKHNGVVESKQPATPEEISRLKQVIEWTSWLTPLEQKLIWRRGGKVSWEESCHDLDIDRSSAERQWKRALTKIADRLNKEKVAVTTLTVMTVLP